MEKKVFYIFGIFLVSALIFYVNYEEDPVKKLTSGQNKDQQFKVIKYLLADWEKPMHSTSIPIAMKNIGIPQNDDLRLEIVKIFRENKELAKNIKYYGPNNYLLTNTEKLLAKYVINTYDLRKTLPDLTEIAGAINLMENEVRSRLDFLNKAGLLKKSNENNSDYKLADDYKFFGGPLRYNFHTITLDNGKPFDVW